MGKEPKERVPWVLESNREEVKTPILASFVVALTISLPFHQRIALLLTQDICNMPIQLTY